MGLSQTIGEQGGVVSRRQVLRLEGDDNLIERMVRRNEWRAVHPGVYVDHTGTPTDGQLRMAAVLYAWPAVLAGESALAAHGARAVSSPGVRVAIDSARRVQPRDGVSILRVADLEARAIWNRTPPRLRLEDAALDTSSRLWATSGEAAAVAVLADLCQQRLTTPARLRDTLAAYPRLRGRAFLFGVLDDVATGAYSVLEHRYLTRVERPHGLPRAQRQGSFTQGARAGFRDVHYVAQRVAVELDGRLGHEFALDQWADLERDLGAAADEQLTVRLGWGLVAQAVPAGDADGRTAPVPGMGGICPHLPGLQETTESSRHQVPGIFR